MVNDSGARAPGVVVLGVVGVGVVGVVGAVGSPVDGADRGHGPAARPPIEEERARNDDGGHENERHRRRERNPQPSPRDGHDHKYQSRRAACPRPVAQSLSNLVLPVPGGIPGSQDVRPAAIARVPAAGVPVAAIGQVASLIGRPGDDVGHAGRDLVIAAGAPVRLRAAPGDVPHRPLAVGRRLHALDPPPGPLGIESDRVVASAVLAGHDPRVRREAARRAQSATSRPGQVAIRWASVATTRPPSTRSASATAKPRYALPRCALRWRPG